MFQSTLLSADVKSVSRSKVYALSVEGFEPGQISTVRLGDVKVTVWRRDFQQKVQAFEQLGIDVSPSEQRLENVRTNAAIEIGQGRVLRFEWFVVNPVNVGGSRCVVIPQAGDLGGFYDPCQHIHFDLWGRAEDGSTEVKLQVVPWRISDDGSEIHIEVVSTPRQQ